VNIHPSPLRHGVDAEDIEHALADAMVIEDLDDDTRLSLGAGAAPHCSRSSPSSAATGPSW
jgi:hypothetical protein